MSLGAGAGDEDEMASPRRCSLKEEGGVSCSQHGSHGRRSIPGRGTT